MTTIETFLSPVWLLLGLLVSGTGFVLMLRRELHAQLRAVRWGITGLRLLVCVLVWLLIAQPRAVTLKEETRARTANLSIDVSESMLLADPYGQNTSRWANAPGPLDGAITLAEAAKIRLNMSSKKASAKTVGEEVDKSLAILSRAKAEAERYGRDSSLKRLLSGPVANLEAASACLQHIDERQPAAALARSASLAAEAVQGLRRLETAIERRPVDSRPRIEWVQQWLVKAVPQFKGFTKEFHTFTFANSLAALQADAKPTVSGTDGGTTRLYESVNRLAAEASGPQVSFLVTDGVDSTQTGDFSAAVRDHPLIVLPIGDPDTRADVRIQSVVAPAQVREKDVFQAVAQISLHNSKPSTVTVNLRENEHVLATRAVPMVGDGSSVRVELDWQAIGQGSRNLTVEVVPLDGEGVVHNNSRRIACTVTKDRYRILVCDAFPRWETRYLQNLFRRDASIELASVIFQPNHSYPGKAPMDPPALPLSLEVWQKFDFVILGDVDRNQLTAEHQKLLVEYVNRGGNLLLIAGENSMPQAFVGEPLADLLPMQKVQPNEIQGHFIIAPPENRPVNPMVRISKNEPTALWRTIFSAMPEYRISAWAKAKQSAQTLLVAKDADSGTSHDFLAVQRVGRGRVAFAAAPCFYHLRFRNGDTHHLRFWGQMVRGMCMSDFGFGEGMVQTRLDRQLWDKGSEVQGRVRLENSEGVPVANADFTAVLNSKGLEVARMKPAVDASRPGEYFLRFPDLAPGDYQLSYEGGQVERLWKLDRQIQPDPPACRFTILDGYLSEERQFSADRPVFWSKVNQLPLGATIHPQTLPLMLEALDLKPETIALRRSHALWDNWVLLLAILAVAGAEWFLRRINGFC